MLTPPMIIPRRSRSTPICSIAFRSRSTYRSHCMDEVGHTCGTEQHDQAGREFYAVDRQASAAFTHQTSRLCTRDESPAIGPLRRKSGRCGKVHGDGNLKDRIVPMRFIFADLSEVGKQQHAQALKTFQSILDADPNYAGTDKVLYELAWAESSDRQAWGSDQAVPTNYGCLSSK